MGFRRRTDLPLDTPHNGCLPGHTSTELLDRLHADPITMTIPVVVLAGPVSDLDRRACLDGRAEAVLITPDRFFAFLALVQDLHARWRGS